MPKIILSSGEGKHEFYATGFTHDGNFLISRHIEGLQTTARIWDLRSATLRQTFWPWVDLNAIAIAPDNKTIALGTFEWAMLREFESGAEKASWDFKKYDTLSREAMEFSPDSRMLAVALSSAGEDTNIRLWSVAQKRLWKSISVTKEIADATCIAFSPDSKLIACGYGVLGNEMDEWIGEVKIWRIGDGKLLRTLKGHTSLVWRIAFSPDSKTLASAADDKSVRLWDVATGKPLHILKHEGELQSVAVSANGNLASGDDKMIRLWKGDGTALHSWQAHDAFINSVAFNTQGNLIVSASDDGTLKLWDAQTTALRLTLQILATKYSKLGSPTTSWIAYTPEGYYTGSFDCEKYIHWRVGDQLLRAACFEKQFRRPDLVAKALQSGN